MPEESQSEHIGRMADDGTGQVADDATIQAHIREAFETLGAVFDDPNEIPFTASLRAAGRFTDAHDAEEYLERGGLVIRDENGDTVPIGWVYFNHYFDEVLEEEVYEVYIDEDTNAPS